MKTIIKQTLILLALIIGNTTASQAQTLLASQLNIYLGSPKRATITNSQGMMTASFDPQGRITELKQGVMRMSYSWQGNTVTVSVYQGQNFMDSGTIEIQEMSKSRLAYTAGETACEVIFKDNGAIQSMTTTTPQMALTQKALYRQPSDVFPYAVEQSNGTQSMTTTVTISETDAKGNPTFFTNEMFGNSETTRMSIEYY